MCWIQELVDEYIKLTVNWREGAKAQLLLGYIKPHVEVSSSTVSRWVKEILRFSGIDFTTFKGHFTWAAPSSKVENSDLSVSDILNRGSWSQKSIWQRFYNKPIISGNEPYQQTALVRVFSPLWTEDGTLGFSLIRLGYGNSALDWRRFYEIKLRNYVRVRSAHKVIQILQIKSKEDLILSSLTYPSDLGKQKVAISLNLGIFLQPYKCIVSFRSTFMEQLCHHRWWRNDYCIL